MTTELATVTIGSNEENEIGDRFMIRVSDHVIDQVSIALPEMTNETLLQSIGEPGLIRTKGLGEAMCPL